METKHIKKISKSAIEDALNVCNSIFRMNAKTAIGYAFDVDKENKEVYQGEFVFCGEDVEDLYHGFIDFEFNILHDHLSGEKIDLLNF